MLNIINLLLPNEKPLSDTNPLFDDFLKFTGVSFVRIYSFHPDKERPTLTDTSLQAFRDIPYRMISRVHNADSMYLENMDCRLIEQLLGVTQAQVKDGNPNAPTMASLTAEEKQDYLKKSRIRYYDTLMKYSSEINKAIFPVEKDNYSFIKVQEVLKETTMNLGVRTAFNLLWDCIYGSLDYGRNPWSLIVFDDKWSEKHN